MAKGTHLAARIVQIGVTAFVLCTQIGLAQQGEVQTQEEVQTTIHAMIGKPTVRFFHDAKWEADKQVLSKYSQDQLARALIAELYIDRGSRVMNVVRDDVVRRYFEALKLPPTLVCQELDKEIPPECKAVLMSILINKTNSAVTQALLRQLKDRRPAEGQPRVEHAKHVHALRVCDMACNVLIINLSPDTDSDSGPSNIEVWYNDEYRDKLIEKTLKMLKLTAPE